MNIKEAVEKAIRVDGYITGGRKDFKNFIFIKPTDGENCCILYASKNHSRRGWQPKASDLISGDWDVVTEEDFLILSENNNLF